jgi:hypothetical protein
LLLLGCIRSRVTLAGVLDCQVERGRATLVHQ